LVCLKAVQIVEIQSVIISHTVMVWCLPSEHPIVLLFCSEGSEPGDTA